MATLVAACGGGDGRDSDSLMTGIPTTVSASGDGSGGDSGSSSGTTEAPGSDTTGSPPVDYPACRYVCTTAADCTVGGDSFQLDCIGGRCEVPCTNDESCIAYQSGWIVQSCTASSQCMYEVCVAYEGVGGCGFGPDDAACADFGMVETPRMDIEGNAVTVCAKPTSVCEAGDGGMICRTACTATSCGALSCGADGKCHCDDDIQCYMAQAGERCDSQGNCQYACVTPADCPASLFDGTTTVCE